MNPLLAHRALLDRQARHGLVPCERAGIMTWFAALTALVPCVEIDLEASSASRAAQLAWTLTQHGVPCERREATLRCSLPADALATQAMLLRLGADDLLPDDLPARLRAGLQTDAQESCSAPELVLPARVGAPRAATMGYDSGPFYLTVLLVNAVVGRHGALIVRAGPGPIVGLAAEHGQLLQSLDPPQLSGLSWEEARARGVPVIDLPPAGFWRRSLQVLRRPVGAQSLPQRERALAQAKHSLEELGRAWGRPTDAVEVGWPIYAAASTRGLLDAVGGSSLPPIPGFFTS